MPKEKDYKEEERKRGRMDKKTKDDDDRSIDDDDRSVEEKSRNKIQRSRRERERRDRKDSDSHRRKKREHQSRDDKRDSKRRKGRKSKHRKNESDDDDDDDRSDDNDDDDDYSSDDSYDRKRKKRKRSNHRKQKKKSSSSSRKRSKRSRKYASSESDDSDSESGSEGSSSSDTDNGNRKNSKGTSSSSKVVNRKLLDKLTARGETLEERAERRAQKRAAKIQARFGYTAEENPFNDPNLHETFTWTKKKQKTAAQGGVDGSGGKKANDTLQEIESIRQRRKERDFERQEMERVREEESRMKELMNYDDWAKKEEQFHLEQQKKRSAIRLVEGRERPIDILAKNLLLFGLSDDDGTDNENSAAAVKYKERYSALDRLKRLEADLQEPQTFLKLLKLDELQELIVDIDAFRMLEKEVSTGYDDSNSVVIMYWDSLHRVTQDEIKLLQNGGKNSSYGKKVASIQEIFVGQSRKDLESMKREIETKVRNNNHTTTTITSSSSSGSGFGTGPSSTDPTYWKSVVEQLDVRLAKIDLSDLHAKMLVRQIEKLEQRKLERYEESNKNKVNDAGNDGQTTRGGTGVTIPKNAPADLGNGEEEFGAADEVDVSTNNNNNTNQQHQNSAVPYGRHGGHHQHQYGTSRKPRYFNRVKTGYDWNKYNQTHYDSENPPPKTVQGYKFNIFYPDLIDPTKTPQYFIEKADRNNEYCILRFTAGPPYDDVAFKIINREWNRSRKRGFRCTFERGVLSLYFNFNTHWYRR